jgi:hypothetical protein
MMNKIIIMEKEPYLVSDEEIQLGDVAIVTVGNQYPSRVVCENETVLSLIKDPKLTLTKSYKLVGEPDKVNLPEARINNIIENGGICDVIIDGAELKFTTV